MLEVRSSVQLHVFACGAWHFHKTVARSALTGPRTHGLRRIIQFTMIDRDQRDFGLTLALCSHGEAQRTLMHTRPHGFD